MEVWRAGELAIEKGRDGHDCIVEIGGTLVVDLDRRDIEQLAKDGYIGARFMQFMGPVAGWAPEDKVHIKLEEPFEEGRILSLSLDPGGDLYFTVWRGEKLRQISAYERFDDLRSLVEADPSDKLRRLGITAVELSSLNLLAQI